MQALTKNDMKPSRAPCFFSKSSFSRSRSAITLVMSTSLKVVSMAAVFCASLRRLAMVRRSRVMRTRSSRSARERGPAGTAGLAAGAVGAGIDERAAITSALVARPSLPVGWIADGVHAGLLDQLAGGRTRGGDVGVGRGGRGNRRRARRRRRCGLRRSRGRCSGRLRRSSARGARRTGLDVAQHAADLDGGAFLDGKIDHGTGHRGIHLDGDLVGLQLAQRLVDGDGIARLDQPLGDGRLGDRFAQRGDLDLDSHYQTLLSARSGQRVSARSTRSACSLTCVRAEPVAGDAASGRPI